MADFDPSSDLYQRAKLLLFDAVEQPATKRVVFLDRMCGSDRALRTEVESLLQHSDDREDAFSETALHRGRELLRDAWAPVEGEGPGVAFADELPTTVGRYDIVRPLGRGGMGVVFEATQENPHRRVAIKLIRPGAVSSESLRRFRHEVEALGQLHHSGIAQIFDAGTAHVRRPVSGSSTQPFFAMEFVHGERLIEFADERNLSAGDRLDLIARICDAVQHAHQRGIIHRDLKPANILVTEAGQPKILDFGVARATHADLAATTVQTTAGDLLGTIPYMSPEQLAGDPRDIDTRCDVYGLGVVAFELLTGRPPFDTKNKSVAQAIRVLSETEPARAGAIRPELGGDVEAILAKALERDPDRRYISAAELAADIRRFLANEPITARVPNALYLLGRFTRRNRILVGAATTVFLVLIGATAWTTWAMVQAREATDRATAINDFMEDILSTADPDVRPADVRLVEVLRDAADEAVTRFADLPEVEADVRLILGNAFRTLALHLEATEQISRARDLLVETRGPDDLETLEVTVQLAWLLHRVKREDQAMNLAEDVLARLPSRFNDQPMALRARLVRTDVMRARGEIDAAIDEARAILSLARESLGEDHVVTLSALSRLGQFLWVRLVRGLSIDPDADLAESIAFRRQRLEKRRQVSGEEHMETHHARAGLALSLIRAGQFKEAAELANRVLETAPARFGEDHEVCTRSLMVLRLAAFGEGRYEEAAGFLVREIDAERRRAGGKDSVESLSPMSDGLVVLDVGGRLDVGEEYAGVLYDRFRENSAHDPALAVRYRAILTRFISRQGRLDEADAHFAEILPLEEYATGDLPRAWIDVAYGGHLTALGRFEEAESRLLSARERLTEKSWIRVAVRQELARLYEAWGQPEQAAEWRARAAMPPG